jgi:hypothetical protein
MTNTIQSLEDYKRLKKLGISMPALRAVIGSLEYLDDELQKLNKRLDKLEELLDEEDS